MYSLNILFEILVLIFVPMGYTSKAPKEVWYTSKAPSRWAMNYRLTTTGLIGRLNTMQWTKNWHHLTSQFKYFLGTSTQVIFVLSMGRWREVRIYVSIIYIGLLRWQMRSWLLYEENCQKREGSVGKGQWDTNKGEMMARCLLIDTNSFVSVLYIYCVINPYWHQVNTTHGVYFFNFNWCDLYLVFKMYFFTICFITLIWSYLLHFKIHFLFE